MNPKIALIVGTRPEIIKLSPVIKELEKRKINFFLIHSNQHYSENMDQVFFDNLSLPRPNYNLQIGSDSQARQTAKIMLKLENILIKLKPDILIVQGDTNTVLASAITASKLNIKIAHVEAGLRSYDRQMPEEINRILTDHISTYLFSVSEIQKNILINEGVPSNKIHTTGNTIVDSLHYASTLNNHKLLSDFNSKLEEKNYFLLTAHRPSNVDDKNSLGELIEVCSLLSNKYNKKLLWPVHPRTLSHLEKYKIVIPDHFILIGPIDYLNFIYLLKKSFMVLTDSGGIQEEACILQVPCLTLRENTERPESVEVGANKLIGRCISSAEKAVEYFMNRKHDWKNPFGQGDAAQKIVDILLN